MDLTGMEVSVIAYNEPRHLYVCLDGLTRVHGIDEFPITVYVDGPLPEEVLAEQQNVIASFPGVSAEFTDTHLGICGNVTRAIREPIEKRGAPLVMYIEDDHLVRPDVLQVPLADESGCFFVGLSFFYEFKMCRYAPKGNVIRADNAMLLLDWIDRRQWVGMKVRKESDRILTEDYTGHDYIFNSYVVWHDKYTMFPNGYFLAHFGLFGSNFHRAMASEELLHLEERMFNGYREHWLDNITSIMEHGDYPTEPGVLNSRLWPRGFVYYGEPKRRDSGGIYSDGLSPGRS